MELYRECGDTCRVFRARFYQRKLGISVLERDGFAELHRLCQSYLEGLQWVSRRTLSSLVRFSFSDCISRS